MQDVILFNGGNTAPKPYLAVSGDLDIGSNTASDMATAIAGQAKAAYLYFHNPAGASGDSVRGHLTTVLSPERVAPATAAWWQMLFYGDATARSMFVGTGCGLCGNASDHEYGEKGL